MEPMRLYDFGQDLEEDLDEVTNESSRFLPESQLVLTGEMFGVSKTEIDITVEGHAKQKEAESEERKADQNDRADKKPKKRIKQSLYSTIGDELLKNYILIRDELRNVYYYDDGIYYKENSILLAEFIKRNMPDTLIRQVSDPGFYNKLLVDLKSDYRLAIVDRKKLDKRMKYLVAFQNGVYDCRQGRFLEFSPDFYLFSKLEVKYCENARADIFEGFLDTVSGGDIAVRSLIWEMIAYLLLPNNDGKCFFMLGTAPNSGKSLLAKVIEAMFPDSVVNRAPIASISGRFGLASMAEKRINIAPECVDEKISAEVVNNIKLLTGEESVNVERKGIDASREYISCKLLMATNRATSFAVKDDAFWNRMRIVPFLYSIPLKDQRTDLFDELKRELDSIASIAVSEYTGPLIDSNYQFTVPDDSERLMCQWRNSRLDNLKEFLESHCKVTHDPFDFIPVDELYEEYCQWLKHSYCYTLPFAKNDFGRKVRENFTQCVEPRDKERRGKKSVRVFHGICWLKDFDAD